MSTAKTLICILLPVLFVTACSKDINSDHPVDNLSRQANVILQLNASCSKAVLLAANEKNMAVNFNWPAFQPGNGIAENYTVEVDIAGNGFTEPIDIASTNNKTISFSVAALNAQLRKISIPGNLTRFEFRVRLNRPNAAPQYSQGIALEASTYDVYNEYAASSTFRLPGNYQDWQVDIAPKAVSVKGDGEYEGFINMSVPKPMFVMVKGVTTFEYSNMYFDLGEGKFGPGKYIFLLPDNGVYKVSLSTQTYKWSTTRIDQFSVHGTATAQSDLDMDYDANSQTWSAVVNLGAGGFSFRANHSDKIRLGSNSGTTAGSLQSNGDVINVKTAGKYKLVLSVLNAGNYSYGLQRIP
jgi:hypothetical protein